MNGNGTKAIIWIITTFVVPLVIGGASLLIKTTFENSNRLSALERDTEHRLLQVERKIDQLLEWRKPQ